jgi:hypothetical protein
MKHCKISAKGGGAVYEMHLYVPHLMMHALHCEVLRG